MCEQCAKALIVLVCGKCSGSQRRSIQVFSPHSNELFSQYILSKSLLCSNNTMLEQYFGINFVQVDECRGQDFKVALIACPVMLRVLGVNG